MKVTVELTDEQAAAWQRRWGRPYDYIDNEEHYAAAGDLFHDAIVAARPKPLKVGDKVRCSGSTHTHEILAFGQTGNARWFVFTSGSGAYFWFDPACLLMADGSPIVWPE